MKFWIIFQHLLVLVSIITGCVSISVFLSLVGIPIVITRSAIRLKICAITAEIEKYKSIIKKNLKKYDKILLLAKNKLNSIAIKFSKVLKFNLNVSYNEFISANTVLKEYDDIKKEIKNLKTDLSGILVYL